MAINYFDQLVQGYGGQEDELTQAIDALGIQAQAPQAVAPQAGSIEALMANQQEIQRIQAERAAALSNLSAVGARRPSKRLLREGQSFMEAFRDPSEAQREFAIRAGMALLSDDGTKSLSQRIGQALGSGAQGLQEVRQQGIASEAAQAQAQLAQLQLQQEGAQQQMGFTKDIAGMQAAAVEAERDRLKDAQAQRNADRAYGLDVQKYLDPNYAPDPMIKRQNERAKLFALREGTTDQTQIDRIDQRITELDASLAPKETWDVATQTWRRPATTSKQVQPTKTTVDLLSSVRSGGEIADLGFDLVYNPIQDAIYGQEQVIPVIGQLKSTAEQLLDPEVAEFAEKANRYNINAFLPYARTLAPVTELDAEKLQIAKGLLQKSNRSGQIANFEDKTLPAIANEIYDSNVLYKGGDDAEGEAVYGPQVAAQNQLIFAETALNGALQGQGFLMPDGSMQPADRQVGRQKRLLKMFPTVNKSVTLRNRPGVFQLEGRVISQNFINQMSRQMRLSPQDYMTAFNVQPF